MEIKAKKTKEELKKVLRKNEKRLKVLFDNVYDVIVYVDKYGKVVDINRQCERIFGYRPEELIDKNVFKLGVLTPSFLAKMVGNFKNIIKPGDIPDLLEFTIKHKNGRRIFVEANSSVIKREDNIMILSIVRDNTRRKEEAKKLREKISELESINKKMIERELEMVKLKEEKERLEREYDF